MANPAASWTDPATPRPRPASLRFLLRLVIGIPVMVALLMGPAGTFRYWQGWAYLAVLLVPLVPAAAHFMRVSPDLLHRRMRMRERDPAQRRLIAFALVPYLLTFMLPALDHRMGWSTMPGWLSGVGCALVLAGYLLVIWVMDVNRFAARTVQVERGQTVVTGGPYRWIRHPMYLGQVVMLLATPVALGSWWALVPAALVPVILVLRIRGEERILLRELHGYDEYVTRTPFRLVPGVW